MAKKSKKFSILSPILGGPKKKRRGRKSRATLKGRSLSKIKVRTKAGAYDLRASRHFNASRNVGSPRAKEGHRMVALGYLQLKNAYSARAPK
jgi:hypothetical protein